MRTHELIFENETCNVWKITWPSGTGLDWHDHGDSDAEIIVLEGILHETCQYKDPEGWQVAEWSRWWFAGQKYKTNSIVRHKVVNEQMKTATTLHFYTPPLNVEYPEALEIG